MLSLLFHRISCEIVITAQNYKKPLFFNKIDAFKNLRLRLQYEELSRRSFETGPSSIIAILTTFFQKTKILVSRFYRLYLGKMVVRMNIHPFKSSNLIKGKDQVNCRLVGLFLPPQNKINDIIFEGNFGSYHFLLNAFQLRSGVGHEQQLRIQSSRSVHFYCKLRVLNSQGSRLKYEIYS